MHRLQLALLAALLAGCDNQDVDRLGRVCRTTAQHLDTQAGGVSDQLARGWQAARAEGQVEGRVEARLRWDRQLAAVPLRVRLAGPGVVRLEGKVASEELRRRARLVAEETVGVERVEDALEVETKPD